MATRSKWKNWGDHPGYVALGVLAAVAAIASMLTSALKPPSDQEVSEADRGPLRPTLPREFASFANHYPTTNSGWDFQIFNDNRYLGRSSVWYETSESTIEGDSFLRVHFSLDRGKRSTISEAYSGIFVDLNPPLGVDLTAYSAVRFRARRHEDSTETPLRYFINLANPKIRDYAYHQFDFTQLAGQNGSFSQVTIPFSLLQQPDFANDRSYQFNVDHVYRLAFFIKIKGQRGAGHLDLDDIAFVDANGLH